MLEEKYIKDIVKQSDACIPTQNHLERDRHVAQSWQLKYHGLPQSCDFLKLVNNS